MADSWPVPKDALKAAVDVLADALSPTTVAHTAPRVIPDPFVRVDVVGGDQPNVVTDMPRILVESWAGSAATAYSGARAALAALKNARGQWFGGAFIRGFGNVDGPVNFPDPDVPDFQRWLFHGDLNVATHSPLEGS